MAAKAATKANGGSIWGFLVWAAIAGAIAVPEAIPFIIALGVIGFIVWAISGIQTGENPQLMRTGKRGTATVLSIRPLGTVSRNAQGVEVRNHAIQLALQPPNKVGYQSSISRQLPVHARLPEAGDHFNAWFDKNSAAFHVQLSTAVAAPSTSTQSQSAAIGGPGHTHPSTSNDEVAPFVKSQADTGETFDFARRGMDARARIEAVQSDADGIYDITVHVTPRGKPSYRTTLVTAVPMDRLNDLAVGRTLRLRVDPNRPGGPVFVL